MYSRTCCGQFDLASSRPTLWFIALSEQATLLTVDSLPFTIGAAPYFDTVETGLLPPEPRIYIRIEPARLGTDVMAMVDTGAPWCILEPHIGNAIRVHLEELPGEVSLGTRLGRFEGKLYRGNVRLLAEQGEDLEIETTIFLCPDWPAGNFVGYLGFLERFRSALDPQESMFYFGPLE